MSGGSAHPARERADAEEIIEWLARQPKPRPDPYTRLVSQLARDVLALADENERLRLEVADRGSPSYESQTRRAINADNRVRVLTEALERYGRHDTNCSWWGDDRGKRCSCGYLVALSVVPPSPAAQSSEEAWGTNADGIVGDGYSVPPSPAAEETT